MQLRKYNFLTKKKKRNQVYGTQRTCCQNDYEQEETKMNPRIILKRAGGIFFFFVI